MAQEFDFTEGTQSFFVGGLPVVFKAPSEEPGPVQEVVAFRITAFGGVMLSEKPGALDLLSDLIMKGTYRYSKEQIDEMLTRTGASLSARADSDGLHISLRTLKRFLPELLPVVSELIRVPKMEESELKLLMNQKIAELRSEQTQPDSLIGLRMNQLFFQGHPYSRRPTGLIESIESVSRSDLHSLLFRAFNKNNVLFTVVGGLSQEEVQTMIATHFSNLPDGERVDPTREEPQNDHSKVHYYPMETPTTYFMARFKAPPLDHADFPALNIGLEILSNRLFEEVRTKRGLAYSVGSRLGNSRVNSGSLYVFSTDLPQAVEVMYSEIERMKETLVREETLRLQVKKFLSSWYMGRETRLSQATIFSFYELMGVGWENSGSFINRLERVDQQAIQDAMKKYMRDMTVVVVGAEKPKLSEILTKFDAIQAQD